MALARCDPVLGQEYMDYLQELVSQGKLVALQRQGSVSKQGTGDAERGFYHNLNLLDRPPPRCLVRLQQKPGRSCSLLGRNPAPAPWNQGQCSSAAEAQGDGWFATAGW